ncbi:MAG: YqgE/AlgH family protein [Alphaproteobacteria bacterium]|jgi:putative transcriptional regulator|nr:YqgE/AlgH family protein [Alphaproteobacteria bacterium]MDP6516872.1 YqgE/AlgH family protein [Alphaproteobacteria bacterium]
MSLGAEQDGYLSGRLLIAMPNMSDPRFARSVVYLCSHNVDGAMGLVVNKLIGSLSFSDLLKQMEIEPEDVDDEFRVHFGGPVESGRGFVLHSKDYQSEATMHVDGEIALTATIDVLRSIADGKGPNRALFALGYAGWAPGQLDSEIQANGWLHVDADNNLVFDHEHETKWERAVAKVGIDLSLLSTDAGHA